MIYPTTAEMGYAPGARSLGYSPGARTLGEISSIMMANAQSGGIAPEDLVLLSSVGATDNDIEDLLNGNTTLADLYAQYGVTIHPSTPQPSQTAQPGVSEVPVGSRLSYTANWTAGLSNLTMSTDAAIAQLSALASSRSLQVTSGHGINHGPIHYTIQVDVLDAIGHNLLHDVQSVLDDLMRQIIGNNLGDTSLALTAVPSGPGQIAPATAPAATSLAQWLESNAVWVGLGLGVIFLGPGLIKKI